ncbi:MAG: T9SS type A sorting domain-containing protein [Flavobacteriales bacterium]
MCSTTPRWRTWFAAASLLFLAGGAVRAQLPTSVDIDLVPGPNANQMDVRLRANGNSFDQVISNLVFTVRWPDTSPATVGLGSSPWCTSNQAFPLGPSAQVTPGNGFKYRTYTAVGNAQLGWLIDDGGCETSLPADTWVTVWRLSVSNNTGCTEFNIVNDTYTNANNRNFFISLNGNQDPALTGDIDATAVNIGACNVDCLGVIGGSALPGTPCNDNDPCTVNDVYTGTAPNCGCAGTPVAAPVLNSFGSNGPICAGSTLNLNASATGTGTITYSWTGPNGFQSLDQNPSIPSASAAASGTYTVVASNGCGTDSESFSVTVTATTSNTTTESACDSYTWSVNGQTYTQSGTYTEVNGCATEILVLTITTSTSNTTTESACDSYTWPVNGQTYTQSGTYTDVNGCATEILVLTITTSTSNTTTESACDSYTWAVNGQTYTQSGTYTDVNGCATEILVLTITTSTSNTTTESACDSYTWSVNGQTYTQSGTYTDVNGCATEILVLTITESTSNTTTVSECDSYTWSVNGQTYTQSGTYTAVNGCATEILVLTILESGTNTTTESACDSYTWSVNGTTYTQSGTYTVVTGCSTEILVLTITESTSNTTTESACDSYTWAVNGQTYTQSGTYTEVNGCATEILVLTIAESTTNTTTENACESYTWSVNGQTYTQSGTYTAVNGCVTEVLVLTVSIPGTACDDGNAGTIDDQLDANCNCVGIPTGCTNELDLIFNTDANGDETSWEITIEGSSTVACSGGQLPSNAVVGQDCCLADGCYALSVFDAAGDGMTTGGYVLQTQAGARIIDNRNNFSTGSVSAISGGQGFCLPMSAQSLIFTSCDKLDWVSGQFVVASPNPAVSAEWVTGGSNSVQDNNSGYEFWIFDPNGSYSFRRFRSHNVSDGFGPASATRACHMKLNNWSVVNHVPANVLMNVRVRARVNGVNGEYGPACRLEINPALAACPQTNLMDIPGNANFSCGVVRNWGAGNYVYARPVSGANRYQFRFRLPAEGFQVVRTTTTYFVQLNWPTLPLQVGDTYDVDVRVSKDGGATWCSTSDPWGNICQLTIGGGNVNAMMADAGAAARKGELSLFPNPTRGDLVNLTMTDLADGVNTVNVDIFDLYGKRVMARTIAVADAGVNTVLDLNGSLAAGMYLVNITAGDAVTTERLVVQP